MPTPIKTQKGEGVFNKDFDDDSLLYEAMPIQGIKDAGFNVKLANTDRLLPEIGADRRELKIETIAGGRPVRIVGDVSDATLVMPAHSGSAGDTMILWSDFLVYAGDSSTSSIAEQYYGIALTDYTAGVEVLVQKLGTVYDLFTGLSAGAQYMSDGTAIASATVNVTSTNRIYNDGVNDYRLGQDFATGASNEVISSIAFKLSKSGSPTGNLVVALYLADGLSNPTGSALWSDTIDASTLSTSPTVYNASVMLQITGGNSYVVVFYDDNSGTMNITNFVDVELGASSGSARQSSDGGASWSTLSSAQLYHIIRVPNGAFSTSAGTYTKQIGRATAANKLEIKNS